MNDEIMDGWTEAPRPDAPPAGSRRGRRMRRGAVAATVAGLAAGGLGGALAVAHITGSVVVVATFQASTAAGSGGTSTAPGGANGALSGASGSADPGHGPGGGASEEAEVDARVKSGQITQAEGVQQKSMTTQRITDEVNGTGHGLCAELLPELVRLDDRGYPVVAPGPVPEHLTGHARRAVAACPLLAPRLRRAMTAAGG